MANTTIQLKYSNVTATPATLNVGEPAYSFASGKLFVGNSTNHVLVIGGKAYVDQIEAATDVNTPTTIVKRDGSGNFSAGVITANLTGKATTSDKLHTARDIGLAGDATGNVSFDGSQNVTLTVDIAATGVGAGIYGGADKIPVITVGADGRLTIAANADIQSAPQNLTFAGDTGSATLALATDTLTVNGGDGISTLVIDANNTVRVDVDNTVLRTTGNQTITGDFNVAGNLTVTGNVSQINVVQLEVDDPIIYLGANNYTSDIVDLGWAANYYDGATQRHAGTIRIHGTNEFYMFTNYDAEFDTNLLNLSNPSLRLANLHANLVSSHIHSLAEPLKIADGGTGGSSFTASQLTIFDGTKLASLANTGTAGTYANASHVPVITTDAYGRVSAVANTPIAIDAAAVTSGTIPIARGGTNQTSYTTGALLIFNGTSIASLANSTYTLTGGLSAANTITSFTVDAYGRVTAATGAEIAINASQVTGGTLGVARGGTGAGTFTTNGVLLGNGTDAFNTASSSTEGHILTINASGVPTFQHLSGGTF